MTESVSFHMKYWLKLTYPVVASPAHAVMALPNDVMSKIQCGELYSERFGRRHSMLQSHGLFALVVQRQHSTPSFLCDIFDIYFQNAQNNHFLFCYRLLVSCFNRQNPPVYT